jgi:SUKH-3 immunity protein
VTPMTDDAWSPEVDAHARAAGWYPGRRVNIDAWVQQLAKDQGQLPPAAAELLAEFGGLHIPKKGPAGVDFAPVEVEFDPTLAGPIGDDLYPLGEAGGGHAGLAIDESGVVYLLFGGQRRRIGISRRAVANLIEGRRE